MKIHRFLTLPLIAVSLCSCTIYKSHYKAIVLITNEHGGEGNMKFGDFEGQYVFKLRRTSDGEGAIKYTASLKEGHVDVSYVNPITKQELALFSINSGEEVDSQSGYVEKGYKVIIIVKSEGSAHEGSFAFNIN